MTKFGLVLMSAALCALAAERKLPAKFEPVAQLALAAPPEFAADALLRVVESRQIKDRATLIDLAQQAFDLAANAHYRFGMRALAGIGVDTRSGSAAQAYGLKLDAISLQARAVAAMLAADSGRARVLFSSMVRPELAPLTCQDSLVYEVSPFYNALGAVAAGGFTAKERAKEDHLAFLLEYVAQVRSPAQIAPMAAAIQSAGLTPRQLEAVVARFNGQLETISGDDRSFSASITEVSKSMTPDMQASFAKYLDKNLGGKRCEENVKATARFGGTEGAKTEPTPKTGSYWQSDTAQRLLAGARKLRFGNEAAKPLSDAERSEAAWQTQLADYEKELAAWEPASEKSEADFYHQKCIVYEALVELIPPGPERDKALAAFIGFIVGLNLQTQNPVEWFYPAHAMLSRVRNSNNGEPAKVLAAFEASGNPVLILYAALERLFERNVPTWVVPNS